MFEIKNITKKYNQQIALNNVSLSIQKGMNFIVGASGSGKSTLLKIMAGVDTDYQGTVYLNGKDIKELSINDKSYLYNNVLGFVWQEFNLLEEATVIENILLPQYLKNEVKLQQANKLINDFKLRSLKNKKIKNLSGGQKQRVAIARELMKDPQIILADEPTSALDKQTAKEIMKILRNIAKEYPVIVVSHDTSHILAADTVFKLDKGELIENNVEEVIYKQSEFKIEKTVFSLKNIFAVTKFNLFSHKGQFLITVLSLMLGASFLLTSTTDAITVQGDDAFKEVYEMYGNALLDISVYDSFISASGTSNETSDEPNANVDQSLVGLYDQYNGDERIEFITYSEPFSNINVIVDEQNYTVENSNNTPVINKLVAGRMASGKGNEVVIPESLAKKINSNIKDVLDKEIKFNGEKTVWQGDTPSTVKVGTTVKVVGVADTTMFTNYEGQKYEYLIEDSFFFSKSALEELYQNTTETIDEANFLIRTKSPNDLIEIKNELNKQGIVPLGNFEVVEDIVKLNNQTNEQTILSTSLISSLTFIMVGAVALIGNILNKKEIAIFKISGYSNTNLAMINFMEVIIKAIITLVGLTVFAPLLNIFSQQLFNCQILSFTTIPATILIVSALAIVIMLIKQIIIVTTKVLNVFKMGEK